MKKRYDVVHPVEHDGVRYEAGTIDLDDVWAQPLLDVGAISEPATARPASKRVVDKLAGANAPVDNADPPPGPDDSGELDDPGP